MSDGELLKTLKVKECEYYTFLPEKHSYIDDTVDSCSLTDG